MSKYLRLAEIPTTGKTKRFMVESKKHGYCLGFIKWYSAWRQYCLEPCCDTIFNNTCLQEIAEFLDKINKEHKEGK